MSAQAKVESLEQRRLFAAAGATSVQIGKTLYFAGTDAEHGTELWKSDLDGSNATLVKDIPSYKEGSHPQQLFNFNGELYFSADTGIMNYGRELFKSDGTADGTVMVKN